MKILIQNPAEPILEGFAQVLTSIEAQIIVWNGQSPLNDLLDIHNPDLTIGYSGIKNRPKGKLVIIGEYLGDLDPDLICVSADLPKFKKDQIKNLPNASKHFFVDVAANLAYNTIEYDSKYATDIFYYSQNTTPEIFAYLQEIEKDFQLKIIGHHKIPLSSYLGAGNANDIVKFMRSCKIALAFDKPSLYTYLINKVKCFTNQDNEFAPLFSSIEELKSEIFYFTDIKLSNEELTPLPKTLLSTDSIIKNSEDHYQSIISKDTYFHRAHNILTRLGFTEQAEKCLSQLKQIVEKNNK